MLRSLLASVLVGTAVGIGMRGSSELELGLLVIAGVVMIPLFFLIAATGAVAILQGKRETPKFCGILVKAFLLIGSAIFVALFVEVWMRNYQISEVEKYVLRAAPVLDDMKKHQGKFPRELPVDVIGKPPYLIGAGSKQGGGYLSDGDNFEFAYEHPSSDTYIRFSSKERSWTCSKGSRIFH